MRYDELLDLLLASRPEYWLADDAKGIFTLKIDLDVTLREVRPPGDGPEEPFAEEWALQFPSLDTHRVIFELWFRASFVKRYYFAAVDGGRALLPLSKSADDLTITREQKAVADAVNPPAFRDYFDRYIQRFRIEN
jgi:hypothetical protein